MKNTFFIIQLSLVILFVSCGNEEKKQEAENAEENIEQVYKPLPEITTISQEKLAEINKWNKFKELSVLMERFQQQQQGDLTYFAEEFNRLETEIEKDTLFPPKFDIPAVKSRIVVFKTFSSQFQTRLEENAPLDSINKSREEVLNAYNAIRKQMSESLKSKLYEDFIKDKK
ncbi:hypothetical protein HX109_04020 [Galbibacter sp. BG1]|uniref:hypothetical protein n=1 Tax=Galbibacter sp. BG1 TaxID=1170699 RepID=UPI0015BA1D7B|nr:hypothetical protein [Galbibacter sp. BG1]QLE00769.1 hypothetical protein HX109_04020 [Galbibacter sp. BG1]